MFLLWHIPLFPINITIWKVPTGSAVPDLDCVPGQELPQDGNSQLSCSLAETQVRCCDSGAGFSSALKEPKITLQREMLLAGTNAPGAAIPPAPEASHSLLARQGHVEQRHGGVSPGGDKGAALGHQLQREQTAETAGTRRESQGRLRCRAVRDLSSHRT